MLNSTPLALGASLATLVCAAALSAQAITPSTVQNAPKSVLDGFQVRAATMQELDLPQQSVAAFEVTVHLGGKNVRLSLRAHDIRAKDYELLISDDRGLHAAPRSPNTTYQGTVAGFPGSLVAATLYRGQLTAMVCFDADQPLWNVQPRTEVDKQANPKTHVSHYAGDSVAPEHKCGTADRPAPIQQGNNPILSANAVTPRKYAEIAIDADNLYYRKKGSSTTNTEAAVMKVINGMEIIYKRDVNLKYLVSRIIVRTSTVYSGSDVQARLSEFVNRWRASHGGIRRDMAHLFTGVGSFSGVIGVAYLGVVCGGTAYGASKAFSSSNTTNIGLVAHECGHNWGSGHCSGSGCFIMCAGLGGCGGNLTKFGSSAKGAINGFKSGARCLDVDPFYRIGGVVAGSKGNPRFFGTGVINSSIYPPKISLENYRNNTLGVFVVGLTPIKLPYFTGILIPNPDLVTPITGNGSPIVIDATALKSVSVANLWVQALYIDGAAAQGLSMTAGFRIFVK